MKRLSLMIAGVLLLSVWSSSTAWAEDGAEGAKEEAEPEPVLGGFVYGSAAFAAGRIGGVKQLTDPDVLGPDGFPGNRALMLGGGGRAFFDRVMIGASAFGLFFEDANTDLGTAKQSGYGGGLTFGYSWHKGNRLFYPYVGLGGGELSIEIVNKSDRVMNYGDFPIPVGESRTISDGYIYTELGLGWQWFLPEMDGGGVVGFEVGALASVAGGEWSGPNSEQIEGAEKGGYSGLYVRFTVGGGGFWME